ncbi:putative drug/proton antiporter [Escovopsis weberi]|uniref:Putative drug/proton antiporter n=1 Tax=Escovopsis weberi TaxID=150374 RepID=A0A0M8N0K3_ESCWE|nr:putative drug/proton antiporter [Escovopsis weberi]
MGELSSSEDGACDRTFRTETSSRTVDETKEADETGLQHQHSLPKLEEKDSYEVSWDDGDNDPLNPRSFSTARKWFIVFVTAIGSLAVTCASSIYTSTFVQMEAHFHNSRIVSLLGLSTYVFGIAIGPMLLSPLSEIYGRRPIYLVSWSMYLVWIVPQAVAPNMATIIVTRFLDGLSGSAFLAVSGGTVSDMFSSHQLQAPMAVFSVAPFVGPSVGPLIGGFINFYSHWRWTYYVMLIWAGSLWVAIILFVPETYHPVLLRNKARGLRKETGNENWIAPLERSQKTPSQVIALSLKRPFLLLVLEPMLVCLCLYSSLLLGILYLFFDAFPLVFSRNHGFNGWQIGLSFLGIGAGMIIGVATDPLWYRARTRLITAAAGVSQPEFRLPSAILGAWIVPAGIFVFAWTTYARVHWIAPIIGSAIFGIGNVLVFAGIFTFTVDAYPLYAASALAANTFARCSFAAAFPLFGIQMYEKLGFQWASSLLGFLTLAMAPFPFIFFKYGKKIRARSRFASG